MRNAYWRSLLTVSLLAASAETWALGAAKFNRVVEIGQQAPAWKELLGIDGKPHSLEELQSAKLVVVLFIRNNCPIAQGYEERISAFVEKFEPQGVSVVAINVSSEEGEGLKQMEARAKDRKFVFPYLRDESQKIGQAYGATNTPHVFVLDQQRRIAYMGAIDDNNKAKLVEEHFLVDAVTALLAGKPVDNPETLQRGCHIGYKEGR